jgi:predicted GNAT family N-acyltransferase
MKIKPIFQYDEWWQKTIDYAKNCSWGAGPVLAKQMERNEFSDWERVFIAIENGNIAGYCTFAKKDCIPNPDYTPYIGFVFVGEPYRGNRISEKMICSVIEYAKQINFNKIYIVSGEINLYEKYGFIKIDQKMADYGKEAQIFMKKI